MARLQIWGPQILFDLTLCSSRSCKADQQLSQVYLGLLGPNKHAWPISPLEMFVGASFTSLLFAGQGWRPGKTKACDLKQAEVGPIRGSID